MTEKFTGTIDDLVFNPKGSLDDEGRPRWLCQVHAKHRKQDPRLELGLVLFTTEQFQSYHPQGFRNSMAAVQACREIISKLLAEDKLYYHD